VIELTTARDVTAVLVPLSSPSCALCCAAALSDAALCADAISCAAAKRGVPPLVVFVLSTRTLLAAFPVSTFGILRDRIRATLARASALRFAANVFPAPNRPISIFFLECRFFYQLNKITFNSFVHYFLFHFFWESNSPFSQKAPV
jgi:hypothetical protein